MTVNGIRTSDKLASKASKALQSKSTSKDTKSFAGATMGNAAATTRKEIKSKAPKSPKGKK